MSPDQPGSWISVAVSASVSATTSFFAGMNGAAITLWSVTFVWALVRLRNEFHAGTEKSLLRKIYDRLDKRKTQPAELDGETKP